MPDDTMRLTAPDGTPIDSERINSRMTETERAAMIRELQAIVDQGGELAYELEGDPGLTIAVACCLVSSAIAAAVQGVEHASGLVASVDQGGSVGYWWRPDCGDTRERLLVDLVVAMRTGNGMMGDIALRLAIMQHPDYGKDLHA